MNLTIQSHPSADDLRRFLARQVSREEVAAVQQHLAQCDACRQTLRMVGKEAQATEPIASPRITPPPLPNAGETLALNGPSVAGSEARTFAGDPSPTIDHVPGELPPELRAHPRYRVLHLLGQGGMGAVYQAEHQLMERTVALKVIGRNLTTQPDVVERFRREFKAVARLSHPNIVQAFDAEQAGDTHFLVMEFVQGIDLARLITQRGPLPVVEACRYMQQAALGLQHAFERGMTHRDIKPHNLMRTEEGTIKILDFGLARLASEAGAAAAGATTAGTILGTVDYMAPEQADNAHAADVRSDIYSLGCSLYHLLTGQTPFPAGTLVQKLRAHAVREPTPVSQLRPDVPAGLETVLNRMMAKDPKRRYQKPGDVAVALAPFTGIAPVAPLRPRWLIAAGIVGLVALTAVAVAIIVHVQTDRGEITIKTDDPDLEVVARKNGEIVRIRDVKTNQTWELDTKKMNLGLADQPEGLTVELDGKNPLVLRRRDGRLLTIIGPTDKSIDVTAIEEAATKLRLSVPGLKLNKVLADDNFHDPQKSLFEATDAKDPSPSRLDYSNGRYIFRLKGGSWDYLAWQPGGRHTDFVCQVTAQFSHRGDEGSWGVYVDGPDESKSFMVTVRGDGLVEVLPSTTTKKFTVPKLGVDAPAKGFRLGELNTLALVFRGRELTVFLNGKAVGKPLLFAEAPGESVVGLIGIVNGAADVRVEFARYTIWELPPLEEK